jgi:hypothetical protein
MFERFCPNFRPGVNGAWTSGQSPLYNCIAHSVGSVLTYIWPDADEQYPWPPNIDRAETVAAFVEFYCACGFEVCADASPEPEYEKVVIFVLDGAVSHAALQLPDGSWTSKIGDLADIMHRTLDAAGGGLNGKPVQALKRKRTGRPPPLPTLHPPLTTLVNPAGTPLAKLARKTNPSDAVKNLDARKSHEGRQPCLLDWCRSSQRLIFQFPLLSRLLGPRNPTK